MTACSACVLCVRAWCAVRANFSDVRTDVHPSMPHPAPLPRPRPPPRQVVGAVGWGSERLQLPEDLSPAPMRPLIERCFADESSR